MKSLAILAALSLWAVGCQGQAVPDSEIEVTPVHFNLGGAPTVTIDVPDMMCQYSCVDAVKLALTSQPGVKEVKVDFEAKRATVVVDQATFDGEAAVARLVDSQFTNSKLRKVE